MVSETRRDREHTLPKSEASVESHGTNLASRIYSGFSTIKKLVGGRKTDPESSSEELLSPACRCSRQSKRGVFCCTRVERWIELSLGFSKVDFPQHARTYSDLCRLTFEELNEPPDEEEAKMSIARSFSSLAATVVEGFESERESARGISYFCQESRD